MDKRSSCKYGTECYQKNPVHHEKYKHPPKRKIDHEAPKCPAKRFDMKDIKNLVNTNAKETTKTIEHSDETPQTSITETKSIIKNEVIPSTTNNTSLTEKRNFIKEKFLVEMPEDFYTFFEFCKSLNNHHPCEAFKIIGLNLVGPFDVLANKFQDVEEKTPEEYLIHWRYYHDPPEFQTVIQGDNSTGFHLGYFRDNPKEKPVFLAANHSNKDGIFTTMGENIFAAVNLCLEEAVQKADPFKKMQLVKLQGALKKKATQMSMSLSQRTDNIKRRNNKIVARSFNKIGLVVPYDKKSEVGYRELTLSAAEIKKLLDRLEKATNKDKIKSELQTLFTNTSIATDECDFGTGIELGWNIIAHGVEDLNGVIANFLSVSYNLLQREEFAKIIQAHMKNRKKGTDLSILTNL